MGHWFAFEDWALLERLPGVGWWGLGLGDGARVEGPVALSGTFFRRVCKKILRLKVKQTALDMFSFPTWFPRYAIAGTSRCPVYFGSVVSCSSPCAPLDRWEYL